MFVRAIWDKLPECIPENFEIARLKRGQFQIFQKSRGWSGADPGLIFGYCNILQKTLLQSDA